MPDFLPALPLWGHVLVFVAAGGVVWFAGVRLAVRANQLSERTGWGPAFVGMLLLAGATELPELATSVTGAMAGNAPLAVNNLFGGIVMQTALLAVADATLRRGALTFFAPSAKLVLQGLVLILLLGLALAALVIGEQVVVAGVGLFSVALGAIYVVSVWRLGRADVNERWKPVDLPQGDPAPRRRDRTDASLARIVRAFLGASACVLGAGVLIVHTGEAIAQRTGLGSSFVGGVLIAATTSLPELSTTLTAIRLGAYRLAVANIFGSNALMLLLLPIVDVAYRPGPILDASGDAAVFAAAMGIAVTVVVLAGVVERRNRTLWGVGFDSLVVLLLYAASLVGFYVLRGP